MRILTTIVQIILLVVTIQLVRLAIKDIKENGFQFSDPKHDLKLLEISTNGARGVIHRFIHNVNYVTLYGLCDFSHKKLACLI